MIFRRAFFLRLTGLQNGAIVKWFFKKLFCRKRMEAFMNTTKLLQLSKQFGRYCDRRVAPLCARCGLTVREGHVLLFLGRSLD